MAFEPACKLQLQEHRLHLGGREAGLADQLIHRNRRRPEQVGDRAAGRFVGIGGGTGRGVIRAALA